MQRYRRFARCQNQVIVGSESGKVYVRNWLLKPISETSCGFSKVTFLQYSPDGARVAVGSSDSKVYILDTRRYAIACEFRSPGGPITAIDWSTDSEYLRTASHLDELKHWHPRTRSQCAAVQLRVRWATLTCPIGWGLQGLQSLSPTACATLQNTRTNSTCVLAGIQSGVLALQISLLER